MVNDPQFLPRPNRSAPGASPQPPQAAYQPPQAAYQPSQTANQPPRPAYQPHQASYQPPPVATDQVMLEPIVMDSPTSSKKSKSEGLKGILSTILILVSAPILAWGIVNYVFQSYQVEGPSMQATLQESDRLIIWKLPHTWSRITKKDYQPNRGDIIVFIKRGLYNFDTNKEKQLIKRVIGIPGDRVLVKEGKITIFNKEHPDGFDPDTVIKYDHVLPYTLNEVSLTVPAGEVFAVGDNRQNSLDSRIFGTISDDDIVGKLIARILPTNKAQRF